MKPADRVVVTGGAGRLGRSVVRALADAGYEVVSIDRTTAAGLRAPQREADLLDAAATRSLFIELAPDAVIHLAAIAVPGAVPDSDVFDINTRLAWNVLEASVAAGADALLVASSPTVIGYGSPSGWRPSYLPLDEQHPLAPWNGYALSKVAIEQIIRMAVRRNGDTMRFGAFRPCYVIAPEEWEGARTQQGHTIAERLADPTLSAVALFNYIDARDAGDFVRCWLEHSSDIPNGEVFFVGAPDALLDSPTGPALAALVPGASEQAASLPGHAAVFSSALAERLLGWRARHTWRSELGDAASPKTSIDHPQESSRA